MEIQKYSGAGNKFAIVNNLRNEFMDYDDIVRRLSMENPEADGVIFLEDSDAADFKMNYYNKDGSGNSLCGNGLRCTVRYIKDNGISLKSDFRIEAVSEIYECKLTEDCRISVTFPKPKVIKPDMSLKVHFSDWWQELNCSYVDCGSPHVVVFIDEIEKPKTESIEEVNVIEWGRNIRLHKDLMPEGANVNFIKVTSKEKGELEIRSYERGVEGETLACGTGAIASAIIFHIKRNPIDKIRLHTRSGEYLGVELLFSNQQLDGLILSGQANRYK